MKTTLIALCCALAACCPNPPKVEVSPLAIANCPEVSAPADDSFGATTYTLIQQAGQYRKCREASLGSGKK
jgi:hypothetical protein